MSLMGYREGEPKSMGPIKQHGFKAMGQKQRNKPEKFIYEFCIVSLCKMKYGGWTTDPKALEFLGYFNCLWIHWDKIFEIGNVLEKFWMHIYCSWFKWQSWQE